MNNASGAEQIRSEKQKRMRAGYTHNLHRFF
jgi:hypothetical protein